MLSNEQRENHKVAIEAIEAVHGGACQYNSFWQHLTTTLADDDRQREERETARKAKREASGGVWHDSPQEHGAP